MTLAATTLRALTTRSAWSQDHYLIRLVKNSSLLLVGNVVAGLLGLASLAMTARALGPEAFGVLVLITTYTLTVDTLVNFQSWQAITKYGATALHENKPRDFQSLIKFGFLLDVGTAVVAMSLAIAAAWVVGRWQGWDPQFVNLCLIYSVTILFHITGTPTAILRLFDRFDLLVVIQLFAATIKLAGVTVAFFVGGGLWLFLAVWAAVEIASTLTRVCLAYSQLAARQLHSLMNVTVARSGATFPGLWKFVSLTNLHSSVKLALKEVDILLIGLWLGVPAAGMYKIVKAVGARIGKLMAPLHQAIYPDLARLAGAGQYDRLRGLVVKPMLAVASVSFAALALFLIFGAPLLDLVFGDAFGGVFVPAVIYLMGVFIGMITFPLHPTLLAMGRPGLSLSVLTFSTLLYAPALFYGATRFGLAGAAMSYVLFYVVWATLMTTIVFHIFHKVAPHAAAHV